MHHEQADKKSGPEQSAPVRLNPERWVEDHGDALYRYAIARVRRPDTAEDLIQETFLTALKSGDGFQGRSSERTWLTGILRHKILDYYRKRSRERPQTDGLSHEDWLASLFDDKGHWKKPPEPWAIDPTSLLEREEFWSAFDACLDKLPLRARDVFVRRVVDEDDVEVICKTLKVTATNLYVILFRARTQMRHCLTETWFQAKEMRPPS